LKGGYGGGQNGFENKIEGSQSPENQCFLGDFCGLD